MEAVKYFSLFLACIATVSAQNCGITGITNTTITLDPVYETTPGDVSIWTKEIYNVTASSAISSPTVKYLNGLRYPARYEYLTSDVFPEFVQTEKSLELRRDVVFVCADGFSRTFTFFIPVIDENTETPTFTSHRFNATFDSATGNSSLPVDANILVSDYDIDPTNAQVLIKSSNVFITPFVQPQWTGDNPSPYLFRMDFFVSSNLVPGEYSIVLTADDGKHSDYAFLDLTVL